MAAPKGVPQYHPPKSREDCQRRLSRAISLVRDGCALRRAAMNSNVAFVRLRRELNQHGR